MKRISVIAMIVLISSAMAISADVKKEITTLLTEQSAAWNRGDLDGFMKPYDSTGKLVFIGSSGPIRSSKVMKERYEARYKTDQADFGKLSFSETEVEELGAGLVRAWGKWQVEQKDQKLSGWFSLVLQKTPDGWRIIHDHSS